MTLVLAHRGANREAPENTVAAFERAFELGADGVELDVHRTTDDALVVVHDASLPVGPLAELTWAEVHDAAPGVPTLAAALDSCVGRLVNIEIKNSPDAPGFDPTDRVSALVVELLAARGGSDRVLVSSFRMESIDHVRRLAPDVSTGYLVSGGDVRDACDLAVAHGHAAVHPGLWQLAGDAAAGAIERAHLAALQVNVWTVNEPTELTRLADIGVDAVITDVPGVALEVYRERRA